MSISRAEVSGAIQILNLQEANDRKLQMERLLRLNHSDKEVAKILADLDSYPEWIAKKSLDAAVPEVVTPIIAPHEDESGFPAKS